MSIACVLVVLIDGTLAGVALAAVGEVADSVDRAAVSFEGLVTTVKGRSVTVAVAAVPAE